MTFSSYFKIVIMRIFQVLMILFTFAFFYGYSSPFSEALWLIGLCIWQWMVSNIVTACLDEDGLTYISLWAAKQVRWDMIRSAYLWKNAGGVVVRLEGRSLLTRYKILVDSKPGMDVVTGQPRPDDQIEIVRLREKIIGSIP